MTTTESEGTITRQPQAVEFRDTAPGGGVSTIP